MMNASLTSNSVQDLIQSSGFDVISSVTLPEQEPQFAPVPAGLHPEVSSRLSEMYPQGLFTHQAAGLETFLDGNDVCLSTSTASGKSLVFMSAAAHMLKQNPHARILVMYPAKALVQDQLEAWNAILKPLEKRAAVIDGSVKSKLARKEVLMRCVTILMTPDVVHAWIMSNLTDRDIRKFRENLALVVMDETHVYDGVFGTNSAFLMRRLQNVAHPHQLICTTATLPNAAKFVEQLTGRCTVEIGSQFEGSYRAERTVFHVRAREDQGLQAKAQLLKSLSKAGEGRFLAFTDSRKAAEMVSIVTNRGTHAPENENQSCNADSQSAEQAAFDSVMPYRSGYESCDRAEIQQALNDGRLRGVVTTPALELGIDIGEIDTVVMYGLPLTMNSFWQRFGRAGRKRAGYCIVVDSTEALGCEGQALTEYLNRPLEHASLYLENRYAQYTNALCAAAEHRQLGKTVVGDCFASLPAEFSSFVTSELQETEFVDPDLYPFKQQAAGEGPHREFPLRSGIEKSFTVWTTRKRERLGSLTCSQALREAYPGAIYLHMGRSYRVTSFNHRTSEIIVAPTGGASTTPSMHAMVYPDFSAGMLNLMMDGNGFVAEASMQVSEQVLGFREVRGQSESTHDYGLDSPYRQEPLSRLIVTTGVCWHSSEASGSAMPVAEAILEAFCGMFGVQRRDVGVGRFHSRRTPNGSGPVSGICIFDNTNGSLRLTERLASQFGTVAEKAVATAKNRGEDILAEQLKQVVALARRCESSELGRLDSCFSSQIVGNDEDWQHVICRGETAIHQGSNGPEEVEVVEYRWTPKGLCYDLKPTGTLSRWTVPAETLQPIFGETQSELYNVMTGETKPVQLPILAEAAEVAA